MLVPGFEIKRYPSCYLTHRMIAGIQRLRALVEDSLRPHLMAVPGIADVNVFGGALRQWQVQVDT